MNYCSCQRKSPMFFSKCPCFFQNVLFFSFFKMFFAKCHCPPPPPPQILVFCKMSLFFQNGLVFCKMSCFSLLPQDLSQSTSCPVISSSHCCLSVFAFILFSLFSSLRLGWFLVILLFFASLCVCVCVFETKNDGTGLIKKGSHRLLRSVRGKGENSDSALQISDDISSQSPPAREHCFLCVVNHFAFAPIQSLKSGDPFL